MLIYQFTDLRSFLLSVTIVNEHPAAINTAASSTQIFVVLPVSGISEPEVLPESTTDSLVVLFPLPVSGMVMIPPSLPASGLV